MITIYSILEAIKPNSKIKYQCVGIVCGKFKLYVYLDRCNISVPTIICYMDIGKYVTYNTNILYLSFLINVKGNNYYLQKPSRYKDQIINY